MAFQISSFNDGFGNIAEFLVNDDKIKVVIEETTPKFLEIM